MKRIAALLTVTIFLFACSKNQNEQKESLDSINSSEQSQSEEQSSSSISVIPSSEEASSGSEASSNEEDYPAEIDDYFLAIKERIEQSTPTESVDFVELYDAIDNRCNMVFGYDPHLGIFLNITEYDLDNYYFNLEHGSINETGTAVTFTNSIYSTSTLFKRGQYTLTHYTDGSFGLQADQLFFELTTTKKDVPSYINSDLVGNFKYVKSSVTHFTLQSVVSSKETGYVPSITLDEGGLLFNTTITEINEQNVKFDISGTTDGTYLHDGDEATFSINNSGVFKIKIGSTSYTLTKEEEEKPQQTGYFFETEAIFSNDHVSIELDSAIGETFRFIKLSELDEGGKLNNRVLFEVQDDGDTLVNAQTAAGNLIFLNTATIKITHSVVNGNDKIDLYINNSLLYSDLAITLK